MQISSRYGSHGEYCKLSIDCRSMQFASLWFALPSPLQQLQPSPLLSCSFYLRLGYYRLFIVIHCAFHGHTYELYRAFSISVYLLLYISNSVILKINLNFLIKKRRLFYALFSILYAFFWLIRIVCMSTCDQSQYNLFTRIEARNKNKKKMVNGRGTSAQSSVIYQPNLTEEGGPRKTRALS